MAPLQMLMAENHKETISFQIIESPEFPQILGYTWLCNTQSEHSLSLFSDLAEVPEVYLDLKEVFSKT